MLTARAEKILNLIVGDYIKKATPIPSQAIAREHNLGVSPATIRNDVVELEQEGFISRPHQSAGSVPLDKGYRVYVESVVSTQAHRIPSGIRASIRTQLREVEQDIEGWTSVAAAVLARLVGNMAIATFPKAPESRVRHIELVGLQEFLSLLIVVFQQARLRRQLIRLQEPVDSEDLQVSARRVSELIQGLTWKEIVSNEMALSPLEQQLVSTTVVMQKEEDQSNYRDHYLDGLGNLLRQPEFADNRQVREFVQGVEDGSLAEAVLKETPEMGVVRVVIGQENRGDMLWPLSVVIGRYGVPGDASGVVGVIGPVRMEYTRTIASVELMANVMSGLAESVQSR